nr:MAG TPA: hypothetical protein [Caudoviricetes sp.]
MGVGFIYSPWLSYESRQRGNNSKRKFDTSNKSQRKKEKRK